MADFIPYDLNTLERNLITLLKSYPQWSNISQNDNIFQLIVKIMNYYVTVILSQVNNTFIDFFPNLTSSEKVLNDFSDFIGMDVNRVKSATSTIRFKYTATDSIIIPKGTQISNGSITYSTSETSTGVSGTNVITDDIQIVQGVYRTQQYVSTETASQTYYIYEPSVSDVNYTATIDGVVWTRVSNFFNSDETSTHYVIKYINGGLYLRFGDGIYGKIPVNGSVIILEYLVSDGADGNISDITLMSEILTNVSGVSEITVYPQSKTESDTAVSGTDNSIFLASTSSDITNYYMDWIITITGNTGVDLDVHKKIIAYDATTREAIVDSDWAIPPDGTSTYDLGPITIGNGYSGDTLNDFKSNITAFFVSNPYIMRKEDYRQRLLAFSNMLDADVYAGFELYPGDVSKYLNIYAYVVPVIGDEFDYTTKYGNNGIYEWLKEKDLFLTNIEFLDPKYIGIYHEIHLKFVDITKLSATQITTIKNNIVNTSGTSGELFNFYDKTYTKENNLPAFKDINNSDIIDMILTSSSEIKKCNVYLQSVEDAISIGENNDNLEFNVTLNSLLNGYELNNPIGTNLTDLNDNGSGTYLYLRTESLSGIDSDVKVGKFLSNGTIAVYSTITYIDTVQTNISFTSNTLNLVLLSAINTTGNTKYFCIRCTPENDDDILRYDNKVIFEYYNTEFIIEG